MSEEDDFMSSITEMDLPLMANANEIRARHYMLHIKLDKQGWEQQTFVGQVIIFLEAINQTKEKEVLNNLNERSDLKNDSDFQCILDCCDIFFDCVYEVSLPNLYKKRFCRSNPEWLTFEERKNVETMKNFFR